MNRNLLILGAGQYGTVIKGIANEDGYFEKIDFLDECYGEDNPHYHEEAIGKLGDYEIYLADYTCAIPAIGDPGIRLQLLDKLEMAGFRIPIIVSARAFISPYAHLEKGVVVEPFAGVHANSLVGAGSYISMGAVVNHNAIVSYGCHIGNNAVVMPGAWVRPQTSTEPCAVIRREAAAVNKGRGGDFIKGDISKQTPRYSKDEKWVKAYIDENGHEPTFF